MSNIFRIGEKKLNLVEWKTINNIKKAALILTTSDQVRIKQKAIDKSKFDIKETFKILEGEK